MLKNKNIIFTDLGTVDFKVCWNYQESLFNATIAQKMANRNLPEVQQIPTNNYLLFVEHPHVYTLGKSGDEKNLLLNQQQLLEKNSTYYKINRGGDITYHDRVNWLLTRFWTSTIFLQTFTNIYVCLKKPSL